MTVKLDFSGLNEFKKKLERKGVAKVGILGGDNARDEGGIGNAELGLIQEMGSTTGKIPPRSFIRMPLEKKANELRAVMTTDSFKKAMENGDKEAALELLGIEAVGIIQDAFSTRGFGQWASNAPSTVKQKGSSAPLINEGELRRAVTSQVVT